MNSDQKIGVALLIGLTGFAIAIGFGRKPAVDAGQPAAIELAAAGDVFAVPVEESVADPFAVEQPRQSGPTPAADVTPPAPAAVVESPGGPSLELPPPGRTRPAGRPMPVAELEVSSPTVAPTQPPGVPAQPQRRTVVVRAGDTLSAIAERELGSAARYYQLFEANSDQLSHPNDLRIGQTLEIPQIQQASAY